MLIDDISYFLGIFAKIVRKEGLRSELPGKIEV